MIIFATGFKHEKSFSYLPKSLEDKFYNPSISTKRRYLYFNTIVPDEKYQNNIAFIGANIFFLGWPMELQARYIAGLWNNVWKLPSIEKQKEWIKKNMIEFDVCEHAVFLSCQPIADDIGKAMGVFPNENDFNNKEIYQTSQKERSFSTIYRVSGYNKNSAAEDNLRRQMNVSPQETVENQSLVLRVPQQDVDLENLKPL